MNKLDLINAFRPSSSKRILTCYKAFEYEYTQEDTTNEYASKGILMHQLAEELYNNPKLEIDDSFTKDEINLVKGYVYYIKSIAKNANIAEVEKEVYLNNLSPYFKNSKYGKIDFVAIDIENEKLYIVDLKTGRAKVTIRDNHQLYIYAYLAYREYIDNNPKEYISSIRIGIYQYGRESYIDIDIDELVTFIQDNIITNLDNIFIADTLTTNPNSYICKWCKGRDICEDYLE